MKQNIAVFVAAALATLVLFSLPASGGDDPITQLTISADAGAGAECTAILRAKTHYSVQPTVNAYIRVTSNTSATATSASVRVDANKLYDVWTTSDQRYICCKAVTAGAAAACNVFHYREGHE